MKNGKPLVWILDDERKDHRYEENFYGKRGFEVKVTRSESLAEDMPEYAPYADGVVVQIGFPCDARLIEQLDSCKVIAVSGVGYNHVDIFLTTGTCGRERGIRSGPSRFIVSKTKRSDCWGLAASPEGLRRN